MVILTPQVNRDAHFSVLQPEDGDIFVDIGAHRGTVAVKAANIAKDLKFILIEPESQHYSKLYRNVKDLDFVLITTAAGDTTSTAMLSASGSLRNNLQGQASHMVNIDTLDNILASIDNPVPNFIKIDTEGYEPNVIRGFTPQLGAKFHIEYHWNLGPVLYAMSLKNIEPIKIELWEEYKGATGAIHAISPKEDSIT